MTTIKIGALAGDIARARRVRQNLPLMTVGDCMFQFPSGLRCALEHDHEAPAEHVAIRLDRERGVHIVCDVADRPAEDEPVDVDGPAFAFARWLQTERVIGADVDLAELARQWRRFAAA